MSCCCHVILAGNPNVGKSTIFNSLTGLSQHTGNWSGKTVELASGSFNFGGTDFKLEDLPGTYSIISNSPEEEIARDAICFGSADYTLVVADATCLSRNLNLVLQIMEINSRVALCVNLIDEAERSGVSIDIEAISQRLNIPVIGISAKRKKDILKLKEFMLNLSENGICPSSVSPVTYGTETEAAITYVSNLLPQRKNTNFSRRFAALKLLDNESMATKLIDYMKPNDDERVKILSESKKIKDKLSADGIPAVYLRDIIVGCIVEKANEISDTCSVCLTEASETKFGIRKINADKILTSKTFGIPIMIGFLGILIWITVAGANYPSQVLLTVFERLGPYISDALLCLKLPSFIVSIITDGIYHTSAWVTAVMLPPMMIFFPLFTLLEDLGYLPRLAFNLDRCFKKAGSCGKQALTMCMGLGCNAVGVTGCRIISSKKQRFAAMITNCFIPCNGRFSMLISLSAIFIGEFFFGGTASAAAAVFILLLITVGIAATLIITRIITTLMHDDSDIGFSLELPPFRRPKIIKTLVRSLFDRTIRVLSRALRVSAPAGAIIWLMANINISGESILNICAEFLNPFASLMGLDGVILLAFILALPANEIVLPIILMGYLSSGAMTEAASLSELHTLLISNGWNIITATNVMLFSLLHFPCATTLWTIKNESGSMLWMIGGFLIPTVTAITVCMLTNGIFCLINIV